MFAKIVERVERLLFGDVEYEEESFAAAEIVVPYGRVIFLARCVENVDVALFAGEDDFFAIGVGFCWLVALDELRGNGEIGRQGAVSSKGGSPRRT